MKKVMEVRQVGTQDILEEITGNINFSEQLPPAAFFGNCLVLKIDGCYRYVVWRGNTVNIRVGDILRGFYQRSYSEDIGLIAYELLNDNGEVLFCASDTGYCFVEE